MFIPWKNTRKFARKCLSTYSGPKDDKWNCIVATADATKSYADGRLAGRSFVIKDNIATKGEITTCCSRMLESYRSPFSATVVKQLLSEGLQFLGKTNMDEFGMGSSTTNSIYGTTINPAINEKKCITGGSSGGSAAAVRAGLANFSLGTDTGGSVRQPASYCGVVGFKPSYGRVSRWGVIPYSHSLDTVGIFTRTIEEQKTVFEVLDCHDPKDITSLPNEMRNALNESLPNSITGRPLCIGIPQELILTELSESTKRIWSACLKVLKGLGYSVKLVSIPSIKVLFLAYYTIATAEAASNLSRYDGIRYGFKIDDSVGASRDLIETNRTLGFGEEVQRRIILGNYALSSFSGGTYGKAVRVRENLVQELNEVFNLPHLMLNNKLDTATEKCDVLLCPTTFGGPPTIEEFTKESETNFLNTYINDILTIPFSLAGLPSISVPWRKKELERTNEPQGMQLIGQFGTDELVLKVAEDLFQSSS